MRLSKVIAAVKRLTKYGIPISVQSVSKEMCASYEPEHREKVREILRMAVKKGLLGKCSSRYLPPTENQSCDSSSILNLRRKKRSSGKRRRSRTSRRKGRPRKRRGRRQPIRKPSIRDPLSYFGGRGRGPKIHNKLKKLNSRRKSPP